MAFDPKNDSYSDFPTSITQGPTKSQPSLVTISEFLNRCSFDPDANKQTNEFFSYDPPYSRGNLLFFVEKNFEIQMNDQHYIICVQSLFFDIFMLYGWNLDHYTFTVHGFELIVYTIAGCKYVGFFNYFTRQVSAWLRVFISFDRFLSLKYRYRTWFGHSKNVLIIIATIIGFFTLFNLHIIIFGCFYESDGTMNVTARLYMIYPIWAYIHLGISNCLPFILMSIFNTNAIYHLIHLRRESTIQNSRIPHRIISITLIITTFMFLIMTIPASLAYGFFWESAGYTVLYTLDSMSYTYHILSFPTYMIRWDEFRQEFIRMITGNYRGQRVAPQNSRPT